LLLQSFDEQEKLLKKIPLFLMQDFFQTGVKIIVAVISAK